MKFKCPFCKRNYECNEDQLIEWSQFFLECNCGKKFTLDEVIPNLSAEIRIININREIVNYKKEIKESDEHYYAHKEEYEDYGSELYHSYEPDPESVNFNIKMMKQEIEEIKEELIGKIRKDDAYSKYAMKMLELWKQEQITKPFDKEIEDRIIRIIMNSNDDDSYNYSDPKNRFQPYHHMYKGFKDFLLKHDIVII